jgi:hypothetical protein
LSDALAAGRIPKGVATVGKIVQLIPGGGWNASFRDEFYHSRGDEKPIIAWALMDDGSVCGLIADDTACPKPVTESKSPFQHYTWHDPGKVHI